MSQIRVSHRADADLSDIWLYVAQRSRRAADRLTATITKKYQLLAALPEMGSPCEDLAPGLRSLAVGNYVIFYLPIADGVEIVRVLHGARDFLSLFPPS